MTGRFKRWAKKVGRGLAVLCALVAILAAVLALVSLGGIWISPKTSRLSQSRGEKITVAERGCHEYLHRGVLQSYELEYGYTGFYIKVDMKDVRIVHPEKQARKIAGEWRLVDTGEKVRERADFLIWWEDMDRRIFIDESSPYVQFQ